MCIATVWMALTVVNGAMAAVATFDEEALVLAPETHWGGAGSGETGFISGDAYFPHNSGDWSWDGFVYSNETDTTTPGFMNQFSVITGGGIEGSSNYSIAGISLDWASVTYDLIPQSVSFDESTEVSGAYFTNTTYVALDMQNGSGFSKKFGGLDGTDPDYLRLIISGFDQYDDYTGTVVFYLADFRSADSNKDYIVDQWTWVDLSSLGPVVNIEFTMESSDTGMFGMNTPAYFAIDNLTTASGPIDVIVDVRPGSETNPVDPQSRWYLPVTISGTGALDVQDIDIDSLRLQGVAPLRSVKMDISTPTADSEQSAPTKLRPDGYADLILIFDTREIISALGEVSEGQIWQLDLTGTLKDDTPIQGSDEILIKSRISRGH